MLEVLKFVFSNFWIWLGTVILVAAIVPNFHFGDKHYHYGDKEKKNNKE